jgi:hypothetical protein
MRSFGPGRPLDAALTIALVVLLPFLAGCGSGRLATYPVKGKVLVDGEPAQGVHVAFYPKDTGGHSPYIPSGQTDENGEFVLSTFITGDGAPAGEYDVTLAWPLRKNPISTLWEGDRFKGKHNDPSKPVAQVTVEKRSQELEPFKLTLADKPN